jgi:hypothetical protein
VNIHEAIVKVREEVGAIRKQDRNTQQGFMFRGIDRVLDKVGPATAKYGVNCYPQLTSLESRDVVSKGGTKMREVTVWVNYRYVGPEGDEVVTTVPGEAADAGDKAVAKAMSVALRTAHIQTFQIPTGEADPDKHNLTRGEDPVMKLKNEIWDEAKRRGWIDEDGGFKALDLNYSEWSEGGDITKAEEKELKDYRDHLKPPRRMRRAQQPANQGGGAA